MLDRIAEVKGVGLLHDANGKLHTCHKATLIYADNGRGKTTLASILRSVSTGNSALINERKTIDGTLSPKVVLHFEHGQKVEFEKGSWSELRPELVVFDADFVERNVHSGGTVNTLHRKNLLEFALGESAVAARAVVEKTTAESKVAVEKVQNAISKLTGHHVGVTLAHFEKLLKIEEADAKIEELQKRMAAAGNVTLIVNKAVPSMVAAPTLDIDALFAGFALSLKDVHADAEKTVREHIEVLGNTSAEHWLSQGLQFAHGDLCPYCGQDVSGNELISAYQTHFDDAYSELKAKVKARFAAISSGTNSSIVENFSQSIKTAIAHAASWGEQVSTEAIMFDAMAAGTSLAELQELLVNLSQKKLASPAETVGSKSEKQKAHAMWQKVRAPMQEANLAITNAASVINDYKGKLASENISLLQMQSQNLQINKRRFDPMVLALIGQLISARAEVTTTENSKKIARENLDTLMKATLDKYEEAINVLLQKFGATFTVRGMGANFRGGAPRSEYGLLLRGKDVPVEGGPPSFATALSEGDKRTLAFAFFIASTMADPKLATRIVVIDDPMCSLDVNRKHHTRTILKKIHASAKQLVVLAHDIYFIRDLRDVLRKEDKATLIASFQLNLAANEYTGFASLDIDKECESAYFQHHRLLNDFASGKGGDTRSVAKAIRPMLEGYLHRRFPGLVPKELLFGQVVILIRDALSPSPLCHAHVLVGELNEINDYAGQFHHDTNSGADTIVVTASELKTFVNRAVNLVHKG